ncbi:hypothetical protein [Arthrobacter sp. ZGTC131]|uniref:hypothetical protein n=1 Tax=Arthrobacter sp. ZGTC131 TaxID=2058898 RepID=UPI0021583237|nr:hypothetical protein [Arthrobacter sp. ZGTC131]
MILLTLIAATAIISSQLTTYFTSRREVEDAPGFGALAPVWREGYVQGVADQEYATMADFSHDGYGRVGPNRANPYPGSEKESLKA